jgi:hypothetical protein
MQLEILGQFKANPIEDCFERCLLILIWGRWHVSVGVLGWFAFHVGRECAWVGLGNRRACLQYRPLRLRRVK